MEESQNWIPHDTPIIGDSLGAEMGRGC